MLVQEIKKLQLKRELVSIRRNCADEDQTGIFEFVNDEVGVFSLYCDEGEFDGFTVFYIEQIYELMWGNMEHKSIASLIKNNGAKPKLLLESTTFESLFKEATEKYSSLCLYHDDEEGSFDIAKVEGVSDGWAKILTYGPKRSLSQLYKLIETENIMRFTVDSPYQNNIVHLHDSHV